MVAFEYPAYLALFGWSFAASTVLPLSSEVPLAYLVYREQALALPVAVATLGNTLGACTTYWLARGARRAVAKLRPSHLPASPRRERALALVRRLGAPVLLLSWVPLFGDALVAAAGAMRVPFAGAVVFLAAGKLARYLAIAWTSLAL